MTELVLPSMQYKDSFTSALEEFHKENRYNTHYPEDVGEFKSFIDKLNGFSRGENLPEGYVPGTVFWLVDKMEFIGTLTIRHELNEDLMQEGGHVGYDIRPSKRGKGYGKEILRLGLIKAKEMGIDKVLITCDLENIPSKKVIEANRGVLQEKYSLKNGKKKIKYIINVGK